MSARDERRVPGRRAHRVEVGDHAAVAVVRERYVVRHVLMPAVIIVVVAVRFDHGCALKRVDIRIPKIAEHSRDTRRAHVRIEPRVAQVQIVEVDDAMRVDRVTVGYRIPCKSLPRVETDARGLIAGRYSSKQLQHRPAHFRHLFVLEQAAQNEIAVFRIGLFVRFAQHMRLFSPGSTEFTRWRRTPSVTLPLPPLHRPTAIHSPAH